MARWVLQSVDVSGGFLAGLELSLPPGLTCIIGPRGSGKSTLVECIRYGVAGTTGIPKSRLDLIQANLGQAIVTLRTGTPIGEPGYTIRRAFRQSASLLSPDGNAVTSVDLERGTFLPLDAYSSAEIEAIADESLGEKRRSLLDDLRGEDLHRIRLSLAEKHRALEANADAIRSVERQIVEMTERIEEHGGARARLEALPKPAASQASQSLVAASQQHQANKQEASLLGGAYERAGKIGSELSDLGARLSSGLRLAESPVASRNKALMEEAAQLLRLASQQAAEQIAAALQSVEMVQSAINGVRDRLKVAHETQDAQYAELQVANRAAGEALRQRHEAEQAVAELDKLHEQREQARKRVHELREARKTLKGQFLLERDQISTLRQEVARGLQADAGTKVRVRVLRNADNSSFRSMLLEGLKGARVRNHDDILECLMRMRPEQLAQIIADNDLADFEAQTSLGDERCRRILEAYRIAIDPLTLEVISVDDRVNIELNVSNSTEPLFKDASELSRGQKCTALLPLLLARRDSPLLIDQPEDNLDNHFIYETVVESIRRLKKRRQMIFVTHNANIPVLADADFVVVLNSDGQRGMIEKSGSLDECREQIIDLLEGGREAFELRRQRYQRG